MPMWWSVSIFLMMLVVVMLIMSFFNKKEMLKGMVLHKKCKNWEMKW